MDGLHIELVKYQGRNGGGAVRHQDLWIARIVGVNGARRNCNSQSWHGHAERTYAQQEAEIWAELLGCPLVIKEGEFNDGNPPQVVHEIPSPHVSDDALLEQTPLELIRLYKEAYIAANGKDHDTETLHGFRFYYENGWFVQRSVISDNVNNRVRKTHLIESIKRLRARAAIEQAKSA